MSSPTIVRMSEDDADTGIKMAILAIAQRLTIKIEEMEVEDLTKFAFRYFKDFTIEEITLAFELLSAQKFETKLNGHFGVLSRDYFGDVLISYRKYRNEETRKENILLGSLDDNQSRILMPEEVEEKNRNAIIETLVESWGFLKENNKMMHSPSHDVMGAIHYDWLRDNGFMQKPNDELMAYIKEEANEYVKNELERSSLSASKTEKRLLQKRISSIRTDNKFIPTCKKIAVRIYFENLMLDEIDLEKIIKWK